MSHLTKTAKLEVFIERFQKFQKIPEFLEFFDSDCRIGLSDQNWVGKMPYIVILVQDEQIARKIRNRLIKISWNQLIFLSDQSWLQSHLFRIYSWFLKIPMANVLFRSFYGVIKWPFWPLRAENLVLFCFFNKKPLQLIMGHLIFFQNRSSSPKIRTDSQGPKPSDPL